MFSHKECLCQKGHICFRQGEDHVAGRDLCYAHNASGIVGSDKGALVHIAQAQASGYRCRDARIDQIQFRCAHICPVRGHRALKLPHLGHLLVVGLPCDIVLGSESSVAAHVLAGIGKLCLVPGKRSLCLGQRCLEGPWINLGQQIPFLHPLAFREIDVHEGSAHPACDKDIRRGLHSPYALQVVGHILGYGPCHTHWHSHFRRPLDLGFCKVAVEPEGNKDKQEQKEKTFAVGYGHEGSLMSLGLLCVCMGTRDNPAICVFFAHGCPLCRANTARGNPGQSI